MSGKELKRRNMIRAVCKEAWLFMKRTIIFSLSTAFKLSWKVVRSYVRIHYSRVRGVTYGLRQVYLKKLLNIKLKI